MDHATDSPRAGRTNWKVAPGPALREAHKRPRWASTIDRLIESPMPIPAGLVVKNASNRRDTWSGSNPTPASCTATFFFQAEDGIRDYKVTGVQTCALPI